MAVKTQMCLVLYIQFPGVLKEKNQMTWALIMGSDADFLRL